MEGQVAQAERRGAHRRAIEVVELATTQAELGRTQVALRAAEERGR